MRCAKTPLLCGTKRARLSPAPGCGSREQCDQYDATIAERVNIIRSHADHISAARDDPWASITIDRRVDRYRFRTARHACQETFEIDRDPVGITWFQMLLRRRQ